MVAFLEEQSALRAGLDELFRSTEAGGEAGRRREWIQGVERYYQEQAVPDDPRLQRIVASRVLHHFGHPLSAAQVLRNAGYEGSQWLGVETLVRSPRFDWRAWVLLESGVFRRERGQWGREALWRVDGSALRACCDPMLELGRWACVRNAGELLVAVVAGESSQVRVRLVFTDALSVTEYRGWRRELDEVVRFHWRSDRLPPAIVLDQR